MRLVWLSLSSALTLAVAAPATAQSWGYRGTYPDSWDRVPRPDRSREGKVEVTRFLADDAALRALGHGAIAVSAGEDGGLADERERATYEAAVIDRLAGVGYDTAAATGEGGQAVELRIVHDQVEPAEPPRKPVHGAMEVGVSNHGSYQALAVGVDLRKPQKALLSTRLEARIRDKASGTVLWEGRADIATREGDPKWTDQAIAERLAAALFAGFPGKNGETIRS